MLRPIFRSFQRVARGSRAFASSSDDSNNYVEKKINSVHDKDAVDEKTLKSAAEASRALHPTDKEAQKKSLRSLIGRLKESSFESSQVSQQGILEEIADTMKNVQVEQQPVTTGKITNPLHMKRAKIAIRHEVFEEALMRGIPEKEARELAEKATTFAEERLKNPLISEPIKYKAEKPASEVKSEKLKDMSKHVEDLFQKALDIFDKTFNETDYKSWPGIASSKPVIPDPSTSTLFDVFDAKHDLKIFTNPSLKTHELAFWKQYDYDRARIVNKALGPNNAFEEMIQWTEEGKMWPYPINNEYQLGEELNVPFTEHIFLEKYLDKYNLPKTGPIAQFMELVSVGLSKNPYMTAEKKRNHMEWFANYFNKEQIERVHFLHEKEQSVLVEET